MRRTFRQAGLGGRVRLAFSDCLGPCSEANGRPYRLRRINSVEPFAALLDWLRAVLDGGGRGLPPVLAGRAFAWTGGGDGPEPPIDEGT